MDAAFSTVMTRKRLGDEEPLSFLGQRQLRAIERTLQRLEGSMVHLSAATPCLGDIVIAVALDYLQFHLPELNLAHRWPELQSVQKIWKAGILPSTKSETLVKALSQNELDSPNRLLRAEEVSLHSILSQIFQYLHLSRLPPR